jgi:hypothetical protein
MNPQSGSVGQVFTLSAQAVDGDGTIYVVGVDWGDGTVSGGESDPTQCRSYPSPSTQPGPYQPSPDNRKFTRRHSYARSGAYNVTLTVRSVNADCRPHGPATETTKVTFSGEAQIVVSDG